MCIKAAVKIISLALIIFGITLYKSQARIKVHQHFTLSVVNKQETHTHHSTAEVSLTQHSKFISGRSFIISRCILKLNAHLQRLTATTGP